MLPPVQGCFRHVRKIFKQLEVSCGPFSDAVHLPPLSYPCTFSFTFFSLLSLQEFRAFELLRSGRDRINYLLVKEAKIIAMTCTHAALKRRDLVELAFKV